MTKIKAKDGYELWTTRGGKVHLETWKALDPICGTKAESAKRTDTCDLGDLCGNCRKHTDAYEEIPQHIAAMPEGHRIMEEGETIPANAEVWSLGSGPWVPIRFSVGDEINNKYSYYPICCPVDVQKTSDKERIAELEQQVGELNAANDKLQGVVAQYDNQNIDDQRTIKNLKKEREELIAIDERQTDYIDDLHREHEAEVSELKRKLDASAEASTHERTTVHLLTEKLVKAEGVREYLESTIERLRDEK